MNYTVNIRNLKRIIWHMESNQRKSRESWLRAEKRCQKIQKDAMERWIMYDMKLSTLRSKLEKEIDKAYFNKSEKFRNEMKEKASGFTCWRKK